MHVTLSETGIFVIKNEHLFLFSRNNDFRITLTFWKLKSLSLTTVRVKFFYINSPQAADELIQ